MANQELDTRRSAHAARGGFTLIELLIVILIIVTVTATAIPVMAPALSGRRTREAARMVDTFINGARNRAAQSGRPAGVRLERTPGEPRMSITMSYVEVEPPYAGDFLDSTIQVDAHGRIVQFNLSDTGWMVNVLRPGDLVQLNYQGAVYRLYDGEPFLDTNADGDYDTGEPYADTIYDSGEPYTDVNGNAAYDPGEPFVNTQAPTSYDGGGAINGQGYFSTDPASGIWTLGYDDESRLLDQPNVPPGNHPFRIYRQPTAASGGSIQLPAGVAVDLVFSGESTTSTSPVSITDLTPVMITFNANGAVDRLYQSSTYGNLVGRRPLDPIHFLVGRRDLIPAALDGLGTDAQPGVAGTDDDSAGGTDDIFEAGWPGSDDEQQDPIFNLQDPTALWVTINPKNGLISTVENLGYDRTLPTPYIFQARRLALESQRSGGR